MKKYLLEVTLFFIIIAATVVIVCWQMYLDHQDFIYFSKHPIKFNSQQ